MEQKIVVHTKQGKIHKGVTQDFDPGAESFHFLPAEGGGVPMKFRLEDLKAMFWVRDYLGNRRFVASRTFRDDHPEQRAVALFEDGEEMWGTIGEQQNETGFEFFPVDRDDNNIRVFVIRSALKELRREG